MKKEKEGKKIEDIEQSAMELGWTKNQLWAVGVDDYRIMAPYGYLLKHGGTIYSVTEDKICIEKRNKMFVFFYRTKKACPFHLGIPK